MRGWRYESSMRSHSLALVVVAALASVAACRKKAPPGITGTFEGDARQLVKYTRLPELSRYPTRVVVTLSDEQEGTTAVRFVVDNKVSGADLSCEGRATRTDHDDGADFLLATPTCQFVFTTGQIDRRFPRCQIQSQTLSLRFHRGENTLSVDGAGLDVAFTPTPAGDFEACNVWVRVQGDAGERLTARAPTPAR